MVDLLIKGFKSNKEVEEFVTWYSEQGEQAIEYWLAECVSDEVRDFIGIDCKKTFPLKEVDGKLTMHLKVD